MKKARSELDAERALRGALSQMGSHVGCAKGPVSGKNTKEWVVENTMSLSWRIGRAVALSRCTNTIDTVAESIIAEVGGAQSARVLFKGKIIGVERVTRLGHAYGEVIIESTAAAAEGSAKERLIIPFKNENIYAKKIDATGKEEVSESHLATLFDVFQLTIGGVALDLGHGPRSGLCHRCAEWRGVGHTRVPLRPARGCAWYDSIREMDLDREGS